MLRRTAQARSRRSAGSASSIEPGELFGLLGPNGAGKTTTIKMLITLLLPTSGTARVLGHDVVDDVREVRRRIGYVFGGDRGLYERLVGAGQPALLLRAVRRARRASRSARIAELLELVGLTGRESERVEGYSRGMRQRLHIARGLLHDPDVLFLDEPSIGIDPVGARELRATIAGARESGQDRAADHALHVRGRRALRPDRGDPRRARSSPRARRRSSSSWSAAAGSSRSRPTASPTTRSRRSAGVAGRPLGGRRGARPAAGAAPPVRARRRGHAGGARRARRGPGRPGRRRASPPSRTPTSQLVTRDA